MTASVLSTARVAMATEASCREGTDLDLSLSPRVLTASVCTAVSFSWQWGDGRW
jgi:hypothetical protein